MQVLFRDVEKRVEIGNAREGVVRFDRLSEAVLYLRRHRHRTRVIATLRQVLSEHHHILVSRMSDDEIINEVSRRLLNGSLQLLEMFEPRIDVSSATAGTESDTDTAGYEEVEHVEPSTESAAQETETAEQTEPEPVLTAEVGAEEPPGLLIGADVESPPDMEARTELELSPVPMVQAEIDEPVEPATAVQIETAQVQPDVKTEARQPAAPETGTAIEETRKPSVAATAGAPAGVNTQTSTDRPATLTSETRVEPEPESPGPATPPVEEKGKDNG
jgi:hypothetical protein